MENVDDRVDICKMDVYKDNSFDAIICSHVLEHVKDDKEAVKELYRVLAPNGWVIMMAPISLAIDKTIEDPSSTSESQRWKLYAQDDHVRLYSKRGFVELIEAQGFKVTQYTAADFPEGTFNRHGISPKSVLYIAGK